MELALENSMPRSSSSFFMASSVKMRFTAVWASSKFPSMAQTITLRPSWVAICRFCMGLTPSRG